MFFKAAGVPGFISYDQFLRCFPGSHGQAGSGVRRAAGMSAKMPCTNQRTLPSVDFNPSRGGLLRYEISAGGGALSALLGLRSLGAHLRAVSLGEGLNIRSIGTPRHTKIFKSLPIFVFGTQVFKNR